MFFGLFTAIARGLNMLADRGSLKIKYPDLGDRCAAILSHQGPSGDQKVSHGHGRGIAALSPE